MFTTPEILILLLIATLGHVMALFWYVADRKKWKVCARTIYDLPIGKEQIRRELRNSLHAPMHAVMLAVFLYLGFFKDTTLASFFYSGILTTIWAEIGTTARTEPFICARCTGYIWSTTRVA